MLNILTKKPFILLNSVSQRPLNCAAGVTAKRKMSGHQTITIQDQQVEQVESFKYLGTDMNTVLDFKVHADCKQKGKATFPPADMF